MISLKKLRFSGIGRFVEPQEISLEDFGNLIQIDGQNNNTGGSSGAGKTTVFNALDFLFGLNSTSNSMLQSRLTEETIFVEGEFDLDGQPLIISRGKKLKISLNGEVTTGSSKLTEEKLDQIIAVPRDLFRRMLHKKQGEKGFFLSLTPSEMNSFLTDCLGLSDFKNHVAKLDEEMAGLTKRVIWDTNQSESHKASLEANAKALEALGEPPAKEVDQSTVLGLKENLDKAKAEWKARQEAQEVASAQFISERKPDLTFVSWNATRLSMLVEELQGIQNKIRLIGLEQQKKTHDRLQKISELKVKSSELKEKIATGERAKGDAAKAAVEIIKIRANVCPRCEQPWVHDSAKVEENKLTESIIKLREPIVGASNAEPMLEAVQEQIAYLESYDESEDAPKDTTWTDREAELKAAIEAENKARETHELTQIQSHTAKQKQFDAELLEFKTVHNRESEFFMGQVEIHRRALETACLRLQSYAEARKRWDDSNSKLAELHTKYAQSYAASSKSLSDANEQFGISEELKKAIKSYLSCSFDEALEAISDNATNMIRSIPNMANATIQLEDTKETKEGKVKEEVNAVIHMDGEQNIPIKTLSGGERAAVDIAIDLAVLGLIEERTNKGINMFILDEPFTGLDTTNIEMVLEVLKNANTQKKLIIVDHNPCIKEQICDRVIVVRDGLTSKITQN